MRPALAWTIGILGGLALVLIVSALIGTRDKSGDKVTAGEWAQSVCAAVGAWRGEAEAVIDGIRSPPSTGVTGTEEPQSETPQGRSALIRSGLEEMVQATDTLVDGIDNAGIPDTPRGAQASKRVSTWASSSKDALEKAQDALDEEADTLEDAVTQLTGAAAAVGSTLATGVRTLTAVARLDPQLTAAFRDSSTCQQLREEQSST